VEGRIKGWRESVEIMGVKEGGKERGGERVGMERESRGRDREREGGKERVGEVDNDKERGG
jgi:hypothetical protein